jgi:hypothetical protein
MLGSPCPTGQLHLARALGELHQQHLGPVLPPRPRDPSLPTITRMISVETAMQIADDGAHARSCISLRHASPDNPTRPAAIGGTSSSRMPRSSATRWGVIRPSTSARASTWCGFVLVCCRLLGRGGGVERLAGWGALRSRRGAGVRPGAPWQPSSTPLACAPAMSASMAARSSRAVPWPCGFCRSRPASRCPAGCTRRSGSG